MSFTTLNNMVAFVAAVALSATLTPLTIWLAKSTGQVAYPRSDRWHTRPTALLGGIAIFGAFMMCSLMFCDMESGLATLLAGACATFALGLYDDLKELPPQSKFLGQLIIAAFSVGMGLQFPFSNPVLSVMLSLFWFVGITNALNILDNMDGLSSGIALVASLSLWIYAQLYKALPVQMPAIILAGAALGFWIYNFNPARIFMGDCGSMLLGYCLAGLSIIGAKEGEMAMISTGAGISNFILLLSIPVAVLIIPIFDTVLVTFARVRNGRSPFMGGRDHTSHRLVLMGYSEAKTVLTLMGLSAAVSAVVLYLAQHSLHGLLTIVSIIAVFALFAGAFLASCNKTIYSPRRGRHARPRGNLLLTLLNKKQILQAAADTVLVTAAYLGAYLLKFDGVLNRDNLELIEKSLPILIAVKLTAFWALGLYRGQWRYVSIWDLWQISKATALSSLTFCAILLFLYRFQGFSRTVMVLDALLTMVFIGGIRLFLRLLKEHFSIQAEKARTTPILIVGAGDGGDLFLRELRKNQNHDYLPIGFLDDDPGKRGQIIHGIPVLGGRERLISLARRHGIKAIFIAILSASDEELDDYVEGAKRLNIPCFRVRPVLAQERGDEAVPLETRRAKILTLQSGSKR